MIDVRYNPETRHYYRGDVQLSGITSVIREIWPIKPDFSKADHAVIENARERGVEVDTLFSRWINGDLTAIPAGTREDAVELFKKLIDWWPRKTYPKAQAQIMLADEELVGFVDILPVGVVLDLKTTYDVEYSYRFQVGGYCHLHEKTYGELPKQCGIVHLTRRKPVSLLEMNVAEVTEDFRALLRVWRMARRTTGSAESREKRRSLL